MELWKTIDNYEKYEISSFGNVRSKIRNKNLVPVKRSAYYGIKLSDANGIPKTFSIHRLVAIAFIPNPQKLQIVDHIDRNKKNNTLNNLRWVTCSQNTSNRTSTYVSKIIFQYDTNNNLITKCINIHATNKTSYYITMAKRVLYIIYFFF